MISVFYNVPLVLVNNKINVFVLMIVLIAIIVYQLDKYNVHNVLILFFLIIKDFVYKIVHKILFNI
jgi:hypothetical protein